MTCRSIDRSNLAEMAWHANVFWRQMSFEGAVGHSGCEKRPEWQRYCGRNIFDSLCGICFCCVVARSWTVQLREFPHCTGSTLRLNPADSQIGSGGCISTATLRFCLKLWESCLRNFAVAVPGSLWAVKSARLYLLSTHTHHTYIYIYIHIYMWYNHVYVCI